MDGERMTPEQQRHAEAMYSDALRISNAYGIESGVALLALCVAILRYDPTSHIPLRPWALVSVRQACLKSVRTETRYRRRTRKGAWKLNHTFDDIPVIDAGDVMEVIREVCGDPTSEQAFGRETREEFLRTLTTASPCG